MINTFLIISYFYHIWWKRQVHLDNQVYRNKLHYGWAHYTRHSDHKCQVDMDLHIFGQYMPNFGYIQNWQDIRVGSLVDLQCNQVSMNRCIGCLFLGSHCIGHMDLGYMGQLQLVQLKNELQLLSIGRTTSKIAALCKKHVTILAILAILISLRFLKVQLFTKQISLPFF